MDTNLSKPRNSGGQMSLTCCSPWGRKDSDTTEWLKWTKFFFFYKMENTMSHPILSIKCCCSITKLCLSLCDLVDFRTPGSTVLCIALSFLIFMSIELLMLSIHLILCCPLLLLPQSFPASGSFPMSWLFALSGQSIGTSASATILPMNIQGWFHLGICGLVSLQPKGL